jgi:hypothetical protein
MGWGRKEDRVRRVQAVPTWQSRLTAELQFQILKEPN